MSEIIKFTVGTVKFTETGIVVERPYNTDETAIVNKPFTWEEIRPTIMAYLRRRVENCTKKLEANIAKATQVNPHMVVWSDGHFTVGVYKAMTHFLGSNGVKTEFTPMILQQVLREIQGNSWSLEDKYFESKEEYSNRIPRDILFQILTEIMLVSMDHVEVANL